MTVYASSPENSIPMAKEPTFPLVTACLVGAEGGCFADVDDSPPTGAFHHPRFSLEPLGSERNFLSITSCQQTTYPPPQKRKREKKVVAILTISAIMALGSYRSILITEMR
jgi:hypothetical protein